jgi:hypothetical protein
MELQQFARESERFVREYEYDDETVVVADLGDGGSVDVVGDTAIVVLDDADQFELALPTGDATAFMNNGVLTVEVHR